MRSESTGTTAGRSSRAILDAREERWLRKLALAADTGASVLSLGLNLPGGDKNPPGAQELLTALGAAMDGILDAARPGWRPLHDEWIESADGPFRLLATAIPARTLKRLAMELEGAHPFGRLADADVLAPDGEPLSRRDLGLPPRRCFLCDEEAALCRARSSHSADAVWRYMQRALDSALALSGYPPAGDAS
ncbi:citrate lyase holo-[acyl-carrier protein] synthase [Pseudodesulfovibrio methanolicus]|uniref:citrate lyase holo-[acyl-carrier protein] synthase n=1 Tax=Pseudodesulfovibrio methanolicus TaxID=3126690 RepID=A0ABZ2IQ41_9BACT